MTLNFQLYWSFRSPYSYIVTKRVRRLTEDYDCTCDVRPVYPIAVRSAEFFETVNPLWFPYFARDVGRSAEFAGLPIRWPVPDPVYRDPQTGKYPKEQPYIFRLTALGIAAAEAGRGLPFLDEVSSTLWSGKVDNWHEGDHLANAAARAGLDLAKLDARVTAERAHFEAVLEANQAAQLEAGHWGVPLMVFEGEPFFGQDRFDMLKWRMEKKGLARR
ncbi:MAG: DsbA family protein [Alphaproteobacteria bacterium]|nr:DsbA family protein [Alphaproteobacteria bacterium]